MTPGAKGETRSPRETFLFLQGPSSPLFARIADKLEALGHRCIRVNLCAGDWMFWRRPGAVNYRGRIEDWPAYVAALMDAQGVTGIVLLGEERPHHVAAIMAARARTIKIYTVEMGYLRPDWVRVEIGGSGHHSHFPADPDAIFEAARHLPEPEFAPQFEHSFFYEAVYDLMFNLPNVFLWFLYPHYRWHAIYHPLAEYAGWIARLMKAKRRTREREETLKKVLADDAPYFIFPLQLETDYQIRSYSTFRSQLEAIDLVIGSFGANAASNSRLLVKVHPLDNGLVDWKAKVSDLAEKYGVPDRVFFIDGGNLTRMLAGSAGAITINSTAGLVCLQQGRPLKTLGLAIYDIPGLTSSLPIDRFWQEATTPDEALLNAFIRLIAVTIHVRGNFYSQKGVNAAAKAIAWRFDEGSVNEPGGFVSKPPRSRPLKSGASLTERAG
ncbi:capsular biosynthesis protein [Pseudaminobacter sp. 19-2017]|uniref:Capsular biosynthesis protein n=1 Tax=Pseudaminobacter soli (ex Zhang et al. 2022) TaxID=2831468 RepID=A0A942E1Y5_9HYPH|nr:capsular biosynthesis protein [Pseudaminobacter soli]MBS3649510.1 capsular biosynthesis protein [Pseudaminobacter soli]